VKHNLQFPTDEELKEAFRRLVAIGAIIDSGRREEGKVCWTLNRTHPYWAGGVLEEIEAREVASRPRRRG
jgi:hypothetical protein